MKATVYYYQPVAKTIELTPSEYCNLRASFLSRPDIFPAGSVHQDITDYEDLDDQSKKELENFWDRA